MTENAPPWPEQGPASYFPSIEKKYGRSIAEWQQIIAGCRLDERMAIVGYLKSEHEHGARARQRSGRLDAGGQRRPALRPGFTRGFDRRPSGPRAEETRVHPGRYQRRRRGGLLLPDPCSARGPAAIVPRVSATGFAPKHRDDGQTASHQRHVRAFSVQDRVA